MAALICVGCDEPIEDDGHIDPDGDNWHEACYEVSGGPSYCCGMMYEDGEANCWSCGEPL